MAKFGRVSVTLSNACEI